MPWESDKQRKWGHTPAGKKKLGGQKVVDEYDRASRGKKSPKRKKKK
jgi:hypothetical protein